MVQRSIYLAKSGGSKSRRSHFGIFIPNVDHDTKTLSQDFRSRGCKGTVVHVVGEPLMSGYILEIRRNSQPENLQSLVPLGYVDVSNLYEPVSQDSVKEDIARSALERCAVSVAPPPKGQDIRAPIDGVNTKRCQEWTMEFLTVLETGDIISAGAVQIAQKERDPPTLGIFGYKQAE